MEKLGCRCMGIKVLLLLCWSMVPFKSLLLQNLWYFCLFLWKTNTLAMSYVSVLLRKGKTASSNPPLSMLKTFKIHKKNEYWYLIDPYIYHPSFSVSSKYFTTLFLHHVLLPTLSDTSWSVLDPGTILCLRYVITAVLLLALLGLVHHR